MKMNKSRAEELLVPLRNGKAEDISPAWTERLIEALEYVIDSEPEHKERHIELHKMLDELVADFISKTGQRLSKTTVLNFVKWSYEQTQRE